MHCNQSLVKGKLWNDLFKMKGQEASSWLKMRTHALPMWFSKYWDLVKKIGISHIFMDFRAPAGTWNPYILSEIPNFA